MINKNKTILKGKVIHGNGLGKTVNMPTANIDIYKGQTLPKDGVYGSIITVDGQSKMSFTNVGSKPSINSTTNTSVETFIIDFNKDIYGCEVELEICFFIRNIIKFKNIDEVKAQVDKDIKENVDKLKSFIDQTNE